MHYLLTNDDGIDAIGMQYLFDSLKGLEKSIVAPKMEQSGKSTSISIRHDIAVEPVSIYPDTKSFAVSGTPADCMKLALSEDFVKKPDWILSGINCGSNAGRNTFYSGTVGALIEGALHGIPGIAFSCVGNEKEGFQLRNDAYETAKAFIPSIVNFFSDKVLPEGSFINVNFPYIGKDQIKGVKLASQGMDFWSDAPFQSKSNEGTPFYQIGSFLKKYPGQLTSDSHYLNEGYITCVPIQVRSMTDEKLLENLQEAFQKAFV